jgi:DNA helicase-2/ATP-dependent DNA helicase PcrA
MQLGIMLNPLQKEAASHLHGPCIVLADHGTGKTRVLEARTVWLIEEKHVLPQTIYLLTFTRRAAGEIRRRLSARLRPSAAEAVRMTTLHSLALSILIQNQRLKRETVPEVIAEQEAYEFLKRALLECGLDQALFSPRAIWEQVVRWKNSPRTLEDLAPLIRQVLCTYQKILVTEHKWDLADLIVKATAVLAQKQNIRSALQVDFLMVDEWQDTSLPEYEFIRALLKGSPNLMVVGSPAQSIYEWRGADYHALDRRFREDFPEARQITLIECYRSGEKIIQAAAAMVPEEASNMVARQPLGKVIRTNFANNLVEAQRIIEEIQALNTKYGVPLDEIAILFRTWEQSTVLEQALSAHRLPYVLYGKALPYYERPEVRQMLAYLRIIQCIHSDPQAKALDGELELILNIPDRGIDAKSLQAIRGNRAQIDWAALQDAMTNPKLRPEVRRAIHQLCLLLATLGKSTVALSPVEIIAVLLRETNWEIWLENELEGKKAMRSLRAMQGEAAAYLRLEEFLQAVVHKARTIQNSAGVALSTVHAAKGLEWEVVFTVGFNDGLFPHSKALAIEDDPQEERRLAHVAFSRASKLLVISWFREQIRTDGKRVPQRPSRFLSRLPKEDEDGYRPQNTGEHLFDGLPESPDADSKADAAAVTGW